MRKKLLSITSQALRNYSQILFSADNKILGIFLIAATFVDPVGGSSGLICCACTIFFANKLGCNKAEINAGLYGMNGVLLGMALYLYSGKDLGQLFFYVFLFSIVLAITIRFLSKLLGKYSLPYLSIPFVLLVWFIILTGVGTTDFSALYYMYRENLTFIEAYLKNVGLIVFSPHEFSGVFILLGLFFHSRVMFLIVFLAFSISFGIASIFPQYALFVMNNSFNVILTAMAIGGVFFIINMTSLITAIIASLFSLLVGTFLMRAFSSSDLPVLTASFNMVTLLALYLLTRAEEEKNGLYKVLLPASPEDNLKAFVRRKIHAIWPDRGLMLPFMGCWFVSQGNNGRHTHSGIYKWAIDFIVTDASGKSYAGSGRELDEHYCFGKPIISPGNGVVIASVGNIRDNPVTRVSGEYGWGNHVIIQHAPNTFSVLCHLKQGNVLAAPSQSVRASQTIGNLGSSGLAPYPHLHVELQSEGVIGAATIPAYFSDYLVCYEEYDEYVPLGIPEERQRVMSIPYDAKVKTMLNFEVGTVCDYKTTINGNSFEETLEYDIDSQGVLYIRTSAHKDRFYYSVSKKSVSFHGYPGGKRSSLFFLGLGIDKIPLYISDRLMWKSKVPSFDVTSNMEAFFSELVLPYTGGSFCAMEHKFCDANNKLSLKSTIYKGGRHIGERLMVFNRGLEALTYEVKGFDLEMKRKEGGGFHQ